MQHLAAAAGIGLPLNAPAERRRIAMNSRRALRWREDIGRVAGWLLSKADNEASRTAIEAAYLEELKAGPGWINIRRHSGTLTPICAKDAGVVEKLMGWFGGLEASLYKADRALADERGRRIRLSLPRTCRDVLKALVCLARKYKHVFPCLQRLANMARCSRSTAINCLDVLESIGVVRRTRRRKTIATPLGRREVQDTNSFELMLPQRVMLTTDKVLAKAQASAPAAAPATCGFQSVKLAHQCLINVIDQQKGAGSPPPLPVPQLQSIGSLPQVRPTQDPDWRSRARQSLERTESSVRRR